jgi:hypothetical protein
MNSNRRTSLLTYIALALAVLAGAAVLDFEVPLTMARSSEGQVETLWNEPLSNGEGWDVVQPYLSRVPLTARAG